MSVTYAIGDIHGALAKLENLIGRCRTHAGGRAATFVFVGDYIDRGADSASVVRFIIDLQSHMPGRVITLSGNHEALLLDIIDGITPPLKWLLQGGGAATLQSYGVAHARDLPGEHIAWLRSLRFSHDDGRRFFVHAGIDPEKPLDAQDQFDLLWMREPFLSDRRDYGRLIVHGHTPTKAGTPDLRGNRLNLDTAAGYGGPLTAAVFDSEQTKPVEFLQAQ
jgi:serine/threonine protein phosphatase 1